MYQCFFDAFLFIVLFSFFSVISFAADGITVDIVSFTRGAQSDLRSSELLEARATGYDGNVRELTYKWTSSLGTYLYVYNSHNMYGINNTDGEIEIYNKDRSMSGLSNPRIVKGADIIEIIVDNQRKEAHIKSISGTSNGDAKVQITITKGNCKFHKDVSTTRTIDVYIYKKPTTMSTSTVITLDNLDDRCTYYIGGAMGQRKTVDGKEYVVFEGLTPNTEYQIEVVGQANSNTDPVYAYVYETTKPAHTGTVEVILNGKYDTATGEASGTRVDITDVMPEVETLYLRYEDSQIYFPLEKVKTGVYTSVLSDGNYTAYYSVSGSDEKISLGDQMLTINGASRTRELFFNSVTYNTNGGEFHIIVSDIGKWLGAK